MEFGTFARPLRLDQQQAAVNCHFLQACNEVVRPGLQRVAGPHSRVPPTAPRPGPQPPGEPEIKDENKQSFPHQQSGGGLKRPPVEIQHSFNIPPTDTVGSAWSIDIANVNHPDYEEAQTWFELSELTAIKVRVNRFDFEVVKSKAA